MLVPVRGTLAELRKRTRTMPQMKAALSLVPIPPVYIFNVGNREWRGRVGAGKGYNIPACKPGQKYSDPIIIDSLVLTEYDLADGANNMGTLSNPGQTGIVDGQRYIGVANDIIGTDSTSAALDLFSTNLEWFGVFSTTNKTPSAEELATANGKLREMMKLVYAKGAELVEQNQAVPMLDRKNYNDAAEFLGVTPLWGNHDHVLDTCPICKNRIMQGALKCTHCGEKLNAANIAKFLGSKEDDKTLS